MPSEENCIKFQDKKPIDAFHNILYKDIKRLNKKYVTHFVQDSNHVFSLTTLLTIIAFIVTN